MNPAERGHQGRARLSLHVAPGETVTVRLRLTDQRHGRRLEIRWTAISTASFATASARRTNSTHASFPGDLSEDARNVMRQSFAGLLWSKQFYHYVVREWLDGDPAGPPPPQSAWTAATTTGRTSTTPT